MKRYVGLIFSLCLLFVGCKDDLQNAGQVVLDDDDAIVVCADTFDISSALQECGGIISSPDSFLVGELENSYGTMRAEVFTQMACPEGFSYPDNAVIDSVCLHLYYNSWVGDGKSPLALNVYLMDKKDLLINTDTVHYQTDIQASDYCSFADSTCIVYNQRIVLAGAHKDSIYSSSLEKYIPYIRFRLSDQFCRWFTSKRKYTTQEDFSSFFKGLYICSNFGSATVLNLTDINMGVYYHFSYQKGGTQGRDTTVNDMKAFYANDEVKKVNRFHYLNKENTLQKLQQESDSVNYIVSPAGIYTSLSFPLGYMDSTIFHRINEKWLPDTLKRPYVNLAQVRVDVLNNSTAERDVWASPAPYMLLIKDNRINSFFLNKELPQDTVAILSALTTGTDSLGKACQYYSFDISTLLTNQLRTQSKMDTLRMTLVPVSIETTTANSTTAVISVKQSQTISATKVRSAKDSRSPMTLKVVYSGF